MKRFLFLLALVCAFASVSPAQVQLTPFTKAQWFTNTGVPNAGGCLYTYVSGTTTPLATYADYLGSTVNPNPVILDAAGRADVWLQAQSYTLVMYSAGGTNCSTGTLLWSENGVNSSVSSILAQNNTWTGTNTWTNTSTFNGTTIFNAGLTANGPVSLLLGGTLSGTFGGNPTFSGFPNFSGGFATTALTVSGQITSTLPTGTPPFVIASTTQVPNLNVSQLEGCTWEVPCPLGSTTPNTVAATTVNANTSLTINGSTAQTGVQGTDTKLLSAGTVSGGAGTPICSDANNGATTSGCAAGHLISTGTNSSVCSTGSGGGATCSTTVTLSPNQPDTLYVATCNGINPTQYPIILGLNKGLTSITVTISNGTNSMAQISTFAELDCVAVHP